MTVIDGGSEFERMIAGLPLIERKELRMCRRFFRLWPKYKRRMLRSPKWRSYANVNELEAWAMQKQLTSGDSND